MKHTSPRPSTGSRAEETTGMRQRWVAVALPVSKTDAWLLVFLLLRAECSWFLHVAQEGKEARNPGVTRRRREGDQDVRVRSGSACLVCLHKDLSFPRLRGPPCPSPYCPPDPVSYPCALPTPQQPSCRVPSSLRAFARAAFPTRNALPDLHRVQPLTFWGPQLKCHLQGLPWQLYLKGSLTPHTIRLLTLSSLLLLEPSATIISHIAFLLVRHVPPQK